MTKLITILLLGRCDSDRSRRGVTAGACWGQQRAAKAPGKRREPNFADNLGVFVLCLQPHSTAILGRLSAPQHSRKFAAVGEGMVAIETDACCSSPPPHSLLTFPPRAVSFTAHFATAFAQSLSKGCCSSVEWVNKQTKNLAKAMGGFSQIRLQNACGSAASSRVPVHQHHVWSVHVNASFAQVLVASNWNKQTNKHTRNT